MLQNNGKNYILIKIFIKIKCFVNKFFKFVLKLLPKLFFCYIIIKHLIKNATDIYMRS